MPVVQCVGLSHLFSKGMFRVGGPLAPQMFRRPKFHLVIPNIEVHGGRRLTFKDQEIIARVFQVGAEIAPTTGVCNTIAQRRLTHHHEAPTGGNTRTGQWPRGKNELVLRPQGIDAGVHFIHQQFKPRAAPSDKVPAQVRGQIFNGTVPRGEINPQDFAFPSKHKAPFR